MKYRPSHYAEALLQSLAAFPEKEGELLARFSRLISQNGDRSAWPKIVEEFEQAMAARAGGRTVTLEFAREPRAKTREKLTARFSAADLVRSKVSPELGAGVRVRIDDRELDLSLSGRLKKMFRNI
jgi:F0F1-type ATP synthase delta subunit